MAVIRNILISFFLIFSFSHLRADELESVVRNVQNSVVIIETGHHGASLSTASLKQVGSATGLGIVVSANGRVMTSAKLVDAADWIEVQLGEERKAASVLSSDSINDVALLETEPWINAVQPTTLGDSDRLSNNDTLFLVRRSSGSIITYSKFNWKPWQEQEGAPCLGFMLTDLPADAGLLGGPIFDLKGNVVGQISSLTPQAPQTSVIVVTSNLCRFSLLEQKPFWAGIQGQLLTGLMAKAFQLPQSGGYLIERVARNSPAEEFGLQPGNDPTFVEGVPIIKGGDIVLQINDISLEGKKELLRAQDQLRRRIVGSTLRLKVIRNGQVKELTGIVRR